MDNEAPQGASDAWRTIPWRKLERYVFRLQKRIYKARQRGDTRAVRGLKRVLKRSKAAKTLAVRQVTQDNRGKRTAGIDGVKNLTPAERQVMASKLTLEGKATPVRRIWIPKPGKDEKRPLGIPTMMDRARQALAKMALEPEWAAVFEPNSYGFRPGRSCHDAIEQIHTALRKERYIREADIKGCFDNINHEALLDKINDPELQPRAIQFLFFPSPPWAFDPFPPGGGRLGWGGKARSGHATDLHPHPNPPPSQGEGKD